MEVLFIMNIYTVKSTDIVHNTSVDLITRWFTKEVHIVQYDNSQPIVAVELFKNSERFVLPDGYEANLRFGKKDRTFIYKPVLGCNQGRDTVYFAVDEQMSMFYGKVNPIIELTYNGAVVGSSSIPFVIDRNPIQIGDVESKSDYPAIIEHISAAEAAAADAKKAVDAEAVERADGDAKTLSDARAYTDSSVEDLNPLKSDITVLKTDNQTNKTTLTGLVSDNTTIKSNITTLQSDVASLKTDNTQNKTDIATKQDKLVSGTNIKTINGESILGSGSIAISGGSGLASPWISEEKCIGITDNQGFYMGLLNVFGSALYGEIVYDSNNSDHPPLAECVMGLSCDDRTNEIILFSDTETNVNSLVSLPEDFKTRSQIINLGDIATKQDKLVSGTNIKTINGESILGSGNITISGGSGSEMPPLYSHTITLKDSGNSAYFTFTIYVRTDEVITKNTLLDNLSWDVCVGTGVVSNSLIDKITFDRYADNTWVHQFLELSGQHIDKELRFDSVFGTDFTVEDVVRGPDWIPPR